MKNSEIIQLAWSMHRGQPKQKLYCDYLCNIIGMMDWDTMSGNQHSVLVTMIRKSLGDVHCYKDMFEQQFPQYLNEDWEFYKHSKFYLTEKGKWVQSLIDQCKREEQQDKVPYTVFESDVHEGEVRIVYHKSQGRPWNEIISIRDK